MATVVCDVPSLIDTCGTSFAYDPGFTPCTVISSEGAANITASKCSDICVDPYVMFSSIGTWTWCSNYSFEHPEITKVIALCMDQYCEQPDDTLGGCVSNTSYWASNDGSSLGYLQSYSPSCPVVTTLNSDLGGIGVFISYVLQDLFAIIICLLLLAMNCCILLDARGPTRLPPVLKKPTSRIHRVREGIENQTGVLNNILVEFQEAQCYFMIACQAAVLKTINNGANIFQATNFAQLEANQSLAVLIGYAGLLPTTYVLINMEAFGRNSWYTLCIAGMSLIAGTITLASINWSGANSSYASGSGDTLSHINGLSRLTECGRSTPPVAYCTLGPFSNSIQNLFPTLRAVQAFLGALPTFDALILYFWVVYLVVLVRKLLLYIQQKPTWDDYLQQLAPARYFRESTWIQYFRRPAWIPYWSMATAFFLVLVHASFLIIMIFHIANLLALKSFVRPISWTLGQIIAVTIWAPVICKLAYSAIFGLEHNADVRYGFPYKLINTNHAASRTDAADGEKTSFKDGSREGGVVVEEKKADGSISPA